MAIAFDASSNSTGGTGNFNWTHTPTGTPRGIVVIITQNAGITNEVTAVTYGGVAMSPTTSSPLAADAGTEDGAIYGFFLGSSIPTGAQTVSVTVNGTGSQKRASAFSVTAADDCQLEAVGSLNSSSIQNPNFDIVTGGGVSTFIAAGCHTAFNDTGGLTAGTDYTDVHEVDYGSQSMSIIRRTNIAGGGTINVAWSSGVSVKNGAYGVAIKEAAGGGGVVIPKFYHHRQRNF